MISLLKPTMRSPRLLFTLTVVFFLNGCKPSPSSDDESASQSVAAIEPYRPIQERVDDELARQLSGQFWQKGLSTQQEVKVASTQLQESISAFLNDPNETTLLHTYSQWENVFLSYQQLAPLSFIEHPSLSKPLSQWRFVIAAWPLQPGYLDSYGPYIQSGIANDITLAITANVVRKQHGLTDPEEVTLGLYAIEFLLKGDKSKNPAKRFIKQTTVPLALAQAGLKIKELPNNRRRQLLILQSQLLVQDLNAFIQQWQTNAQLSILFLQLPPQERLKAYHNGFIKVLDELQMLLNYEIEISEEGSETKEAYQHRFFQHRKQAVTQQLSVIESLYFKEMNGKTSDEKVLLIDILVKEEQEKLKTRINELKKQLTK